MSTLLKVRLVGSDHCTVAVVPIVNKVNQSMPKFVIHSDRLFAFNSSLQHCGERYDEVTDVVVIEKGI